eukprot:scaffold3917_cov113-Isochrysis_galbana.AAC.11
MTPVPPVPPGVRAGQRQGRMGPSTGAQQDRHAASQPSYSPDYAPHRLGPTPALPSGCGCWADLTLAQSA